MFYDLPLYFFLPQSNYKNYRDKLSITPVPAVPYIGVFLKDLTFIADGNPDYIRGGLVNLHKRRQVQKPWYYAMECVLISELSRMCPD